MTPKSDRSQSNTAPRQAELTLNDGHKITYTSIGDEQKSLLLFIVGSSGLGSLYGRLAIELSSEFRCIYYNKRGFIPSDTASEVVSQLKNEDVSVGQHADDAAIIIETLSPSEPALVFGTSTGGTAALDLTIRYPHLVRVAILHEPITFPFMMDFTTKEKMLSVYREVASNLDPVEGLKNFAKYMFMPLMNPGLKDTAGPQLGVLPAIFNARSRSSPTQAALFNARQGQKEAAAMLRYSASQQQARSVNDKLILVCGVESAGMPVSQPVSNLAWVLGPEKRLWRLPGDHMSFAAGRHASAFCKGLLEAIRQEGGVLPVDKSTRAKM